MMSLWPLWRALLATPWPAMAAELALLAALMGAIRVAQRRLALAPETSRKLFHVGGGLSTLAFPWLFHAAWPVLAMAPLTVGSLVALKRVRALRRGLGGVLYGIRRPSLGEIYMPLAITLDWLLARGDALLFCAPVLVLSLADPAAAAVGARYGRLRYAAVEGEKSVAGSLACCAVAFMALLVALALARAGGPAPWLLALALALLATLAEAVAWRGLDNLFIPLVTFAALRAALPLSVPALVALLAATAALAAAALAWRLRAPRRPVARGAWRLKTRLDASGYEGRLRGLG